MGGIMEKNLRHLVGSLTLVLCLTLIVSPAVFPQTIDGYFKTKLNSKEVQLLLDTLRSEKNLKFEHIQETFFNLAGGDDVVYDPNLKNLVFFIDEASSSSKDKHKINDFNYSIQISGRLQVRSFLSWIYEKDTISLQRKKKLAKQIF